MSPMAWAALFAAAVALVVALFVVLTTYNAVVALRQRIDKAWGNVEVVLRQRYDLIPNLVAAVRDVMAFERETLERVTALRAAYSASEPIPRQAATSEATTSAIRTLFATVERYPDLRSQQNVLDLQGELERIEETIAARRELYNDQVYRYDAVIAQFPALVLAGFFGWRRRPFFDAGADAAERPRTDLGPTTG